MVAQKDLNVVTCKSFSVFLSLKQYALDFISYFRTTATSLTNFRIHIAQSQILMKTRPQILHGLSTIRKRGGRRPEGGELRPLLSQECFSNEAMAEKRLCLYKRVKSLVGIFYEFFMPLEKRPSFQTGAAR